MDQDNNRRRYRPLVPREKAPVFVPPPRVDLPKRTVTSVACETCRRRKIKCNGLRPKCLACTNRRAECVYMTEPSETRISAIKRKHDELQKQLEDGGSSQSDLQQLFDAIRDRDEKDAMTIMRRIRTGEDPSTILRHLRAGDLLLQLHLAPETKFRNSFPSTFRMPRRLQLPDNAYFRSLVYEATFMESSPSASGTIELHDRFRPQYLKPYTAAEVTDPRLSLIKPSEWTNVLTNNEMMRNMIRSYFRQEHQSLPFFHKDYFLEDMMNGSNEFCSSLLVNAVLAESCSFCPDTTSRLEYWNPESLRYRFLAESRRLWELELEKEPSITTLQAAMVLNPVYNMSSMETQGLSFGAQALALSHRLGILEALPAELDQRQRHVYGYTAWCLYYWISIQYYTYVKPPHFHQPPQTPLPDPEKNAQWYGEVAFRYPRSRTVSSQDFANLFKARCEMVQIANQVSIRLCQAKNEGESPSSEELLGLLDRYQYWFSKLPACLQPSHIVYPVELQLHLQYHTFIMNLCEFLISHDGNTLAQEAMKKVNRALSQSRDSFESIMLLFYLRHGYDMEDRIMTQYLSILAYMSLKQLGDRNLTLKDDIEESRGILHLAAKGISVQGGYYYLTYLVSLVLQKEMSPDDLVVLHQSTVGRKEDASTEHMRARHEETQYPLHIVSIKDRRLGNLVKEYSAMRIQSK
ncbi:related to nitrate assimilation regulatory protein nirA [Fusarium oxysporum]|uniref:Related to nitrate assimilation regulatory protein nirA n=1 Tax=Fusarium oxysporum TaxID=5507 RepID=A0A2H3TI63_FUSOX|nr:related to nitrate assimilation regulatory protein nirA [Fusarium oxysporum]